MHHIRTSDFRTHPNLPRHKRDSSQCIRRQSLFSTTSKQSETSPADPRTLARLYASKQFRIRALNRHMSKDLFKFEIKRHLGSLEQGKWLLKSPRQIEVRSDGLIFVCDFKGDRILALTHNNMLAHVISEVSGIPLIAPSGVTSDSRNNVYFTDEHSCIVVMDKELNLLHYIGTEEAEGALINFQGLHIDSDDNLFAIDNAHKQIRHYDKNGRLVRFFGEKGDDDHQFNSLKYVISRNNDLYVSDPQSNKIKVYTKDGRFQYAFGAKNEHESLSSPRGMRIYDGKYLLVCDSHNDRIEIFDLNGKYIQPLITNFEDPEDVNISKNGCVIACMNDRLAVLDS